MELIGIKSAIYEPNATFERPVRLPLEEAKADTLSASFRAEGPETWREGGTLVLRFAQSRILAGWVVIGGGWVPEIANCVVRQAIWPDSNPFNGVTWGLAGW